MEILTRRAVLKRVYELREQEQRNLAVRTGNAVNGARNVDGGGGGNTSSTR